MKRIVFTLTLIACLSYGIRSNAQQSLTTLSYSMGLGVGNTGDFISKYSIALKEARESVERDMVQQALKKHAGKISSAATELGISRPTLYELMEKLGISRE